MLVRVLTSMTGEQLLSGRELKGWNQEHSASKLGVSQPYLSFLERGVRLVPEKLARKAARVYGLSAIALPMRTAWDEVRPAREDDLTADLAVLGYTGLAHLAPARRRMKNPADVLLSALKASDLDSRLVEALPWVLLRFPDLDWQWLAGAAKLNDLQNRLGFVTGVARAAAERLGEPDKAAWLREREEALNMSRLAGEGTLCHDSLTETERRWLREHRPAAARHWNLLTDLTPERLSYAA